MYEDVLAVIEPERALYLAIPEGVRQNIASDEIGRLMLAKRIRRVVCFSIPTEEIVEWIR